ncbi:MAG TPA: class I SAM-dependent methyltransferase [Candidatus Polarisedimenticolia bacterium]|jgi:SAM-dependent methyltransferase
MTLTRRVDDRKLGRLVRLGAEEARRSGEGEAISRWVTADENPIYLRRLVYHVSGLLSLNGPPRHGFALLDAGGGSGLLSVIACLMGASRGIVIDTNRHLMDFLLAVAPRLAPDVRVEGYLRDVASTGLPDASVDVVLCNEALSHMLDVERFLDEAGRVLRPGGRLVISDSNNETNPRVRRDRIKEWERFERPAREGCEAGELFIKRRDLIEARFPGIGAETACEIATATFGMTGEQVMEAASLWLRGDRREVSRYDGTRCPIDPISNQCADRLFRPYELGRRLNRHGMRASVRAHFATVPPYRALNGLWGAMSPLTLHLSRAFRIVAVKEMSA